MIKEEDFFSTDLYTNCSRCILSDKKNKKKEKCSESFILDKKGNGEILFIIE